MSILEGQFLNFIPPKLDGGNIGTKSRFMLVTKSDSINKLIEMINVSSIKGKENKLIYNSNIQIENHFPLPAPSFAKMDIMYSLEYFEELNNFIAFKGQKIDDKELENILKQRYRYICKYNKYKIISFSKEEFMKININNIKSLI